MNLKKTIIFTGLIVVILVLIFNGPNWINNLMDEHFDKESIATIENIEIIEGISQTEIGNQVSITGFKLKYFYQINNNKHFNEQYITNSISLSFDNKKKLKNLKSGDKIKIRYVSKEPTKSKIILE